MNQRKHKPTTAKAGPTILRVVWKNEDVGEIVKFYNKLTVKGLRLPGFVMKSWARIRGYDYKALSKGSRRENIRFTEDY